MMKMIFLTKYVEMILIIIVKNIHTLQYTNTKTISRKIKFLFCNCSFVKVFDDNFLTELYLSLENPSK